METKNSNLSGATSQDNSKLKELFLDQLKDIYWAEKHLTEALPKMQKAASSEELAMAISDHLSITENHVARIEEVFELLGEEASDKKCDGIAGLVKESEKAISVTEDGTATRDAGLIMAAQKVEHYEISSYGTMVELAKTMGKNDIAELLQQTLDEEKEADRHLTQIAEGGINVEADAERS